MSLEEIHRLTFIDPWFLDQLSELVETENQIASLQSLDRLDAETMRKIKKYGFSDRQIAKLLSTQEMEVREWRR